jgi:hypothetical protein
VSLVWWRANALLALFFNYVHVVVIPMIINVCFCLYMRVLCAGSRADGRDEPETVLLRWGSHVKIFSVVAIFVFKLLQSILEICDEYGLKQPAAWRP